MTRQEPSREKVAVFVQGIGIQRCVLCIVCHAGTNNKYWIIILILLLQQCISVFGIGMNYYC